MSISEYLGIDLDYIVIGLAALLLIFIILTIVNIVQMSKLKKKYKMFMGGKKREVSRRRFDETHEPGSTVWLPPTIRMRKISKRFLGAFILLIRKWDLSNMTRFGRWAVSSVFHLLCWMRRMTDLSSTQCTPERAAIPILKRS